MSAKLFYTPTSCGAASFIVASKAGLIGTVVTAYEVDIRSHVIVSGDLAGKNYYDYNPKGNVGCVILPDGTVLNENAAVLQWLADQAPTSSLAPANGSSARYLLQSKLSYISTEIHTNYGPLFNPACLPEVAQNAKTNLAAKFDYLSKVEFKTKQFIVGDHFTVADALLYIVLSWSPYVKVDLTPFPAVQAYFERIAALDFVKAAHAAMAAASPKK